MERISEIYADICGSDSSQKDTYLVRTYFKYKTVNLEGLQGVIKLKYKNKSHYLSFINDSFRKSVRFGVYEHLLCIDTEVSDFNIKRARSKSLVDSREIVSFLALLMNIGFYEIDSNSLLFSGIHSGTEIINSAASNFFYDELLDLVVVNNMNDCFLKSDFINNRFGTEGIVITSNLIFSDFTDENHKKLKDIFLLKNRTKPDTKETPILFGGISRNAPFADCNTTFPKDFKIFFDRLNAITDNEILKCAKMYNTRPLAKIIF